MSIIPCEHKLDCFNLWKKGKQEMEANITIHNAFNFSWLVEKAEAWFFLFFFKLLSWLWQGWANYYLLKLNTGSEVIYPFKRNEKINLLKCQKLNVFEAGLTARDYTVRKNKTKNNQTTT